MGLATSVPLTADDVVAAVDGPAVGGGCELVAACDLAVATDDATFTLPAIQVGAYPPYAVARPGAFGGKQRLLDMALTGDPVDAETAHGQGLISRVVAPVDLEEAVADLVGTVTEAPRPAVRLLKRDARVGVTSGDERDLTADGFARVAQSPECRAAAESFLAGE